MKKTTVLLTAVALSACTSLEKQQSNERAQVEIIKVQREQLARESASEAQAQIKLYESLARIAEASPESADAAVLAMAMVGQGQAESGNEAPLVALQRQQNEALEVLKVVTPTIGGVLTNVGIAAINANTQQDQIAANRDVQINQQNATASAISSVSALGAVAAQNAGDAITVTDSGFLNTGEYVTQQTSEVTTETSTSISDSYNSTDNSVDSSVTDNSVTDNSVVTYEGEEMTLAELIAFLKASGEGYTFTIGDQTYTDSDQSNEAQTCVPTFDGYVCSNG